MSIFNIDGSNREVRFIVVLILLVVAIYNFFFSDSYTKIVCNKSQDICTVYKHSIVNKEYKIKETFKFSSIKNADITYSSHYRKKSRVRYSVQLCLADKTIHLKRYKSYIDAQSLAGRVNDIIKYSSFYRDFILYES